MRFGMSYRTLERVTTPDRAHVGSLFMHDAIPYGYYDDPHFIPDYRLPPKLPDWAKYLQKEVDSVCNDSIACRYDFVETLDKDYAKQTKFYETYAQQLAGEVSKKGIPL